jgi:glycosidase
MVRIFFKSVVTLAIILLTTHLAFAKTTNNIIHISHKQTVDERLPCNRGEKPFCDLRLYQIMVVSFVDGDPTRNMGASYGPGPNKGDLQGIIDSLDYIRSLNVNAIWLTPIFDTDAGHDEGEDLRLDGTGYYAHNYFKIDPHFGTLDQARELVRKAHEKGMYVFLDGVFGHTKNTGVLASPSGLKPVLEKCENADARGLCVKYPESREFFAEVATYWIKEIGIDGWRLDQAYQVPVEDWHYIQNKVLAAAKEHNKIGYMVAEILRDVPDIAPYIQKEAFGTPENPGVMSAFDFPVRLALTEVLATQEDVTAKNARLQPASRLNGAAGMGSHRVYPDFAIPNLLMTNHDMIRFGNLITRAGLGGPGDQDYWQRHRLAFDFLTAYSGPITIYYGDEIGDYIPNLSKKVTQDCSSKNLCEDQASRTPGKVLGVTVSSKDLDPRAIELKHYVSKLMQLKSEHPALYSGKRIHLGSGKDYYVDLKTQGNDKVLFVMNLSKQPQTFAINNSLLSQSKIKLKNLLENQTIKSTQNKTLLTIPAMEGKFFEIIKE